MTVHLSPQEAQQKIGEIQALRDSAVNKLNKIEEEQQLMLAKAWQGQSAAAYGTNAAGQREEFDDLIRTLDDVVAKGSEHMNNIAKADQA